MKAKGKTYLKVTGILMIIFGGLGALLNVMAMMGLGLLAVGAGIEGERAAVFGGIVATLFFVFGLIWAVLELVAGITGVKNCENTEKAGLCFKMGVGLLVCVVISGLWEFWVSGFSIGGVFSIVIGVIVPGLFCYGAKLNQK